MQLNSLLLQVLVGCLIPAVAAAQTPMQLKVFRGTLVHSRVRTEMEVLEDYLLGIDESNYGTVSCGTGVVITYSLCTCYYAREKVFFCFFLTYNTSVFIKDVRWFVHILNIIP